MKITMSTSLKSTLARVGKRDSWPVASLAEVLGRPKVFVYRRIDSGDFTVIDNGGEFITIQSASVIKWYESRYDRYK